MTDEAEINKSIGFVKDLRVGIQASAAVTGAIGTGTLAAGAFELKYGVKQAQWLVDTMAATNGNTKGMIDILTFAELAPGIGSPIRSSNIRRVMDQISDNGAKLVNAANKTLEQVEDHADLLLDIGKVSARLSASLITTDILHLANVQESLEAQLKSLPPERTDPAPGTFSLKDEVDKASDDAELQLQIAYQSMLSRHQNATVDTTVFVANLDERTTKITDKIGTKISLVATLTDEISSVWNDFYDKFSSFAPVADSFRKLTSAFTTPFDALFENLEDPPSIPIPIPVLNPFSSRFPGYIKYVDLFPAISRDDITGLANFIGGLSGAVLDFIRPAIRPILEPIENAIQGLLANIDPFSGLKGIFSDFQEKLAGLVAELNLVETDLRAYESSLEALRNVPIPGSEEFAGRSEHDRNDLKATFFGGAANEYVQGEPNPGGTSSDDKFAGAVIAGGNGNDVLIGTNFADFLEGGEDNDALIGKAGDDVLVGGRGTDNIFGGSGNDAIFGGVGNDLMHGDESDGKKGNDFFDGGIGRDTVVFTGKRSEYIIEEMNRGQKVTGPDGSDILKGVEILKFSDLEIEYEPEIVLFGNTAPRLRSGSASAEEDGTPVSIDLTALGQDDDKGENSSTLAYSLAETPSTGEFALEGKRLKLNPRSDFDYLAKDETTVVNATVIATDGRGATSGPQTMSFTVTGTNDAPTLADGVARVAKNEDFVTIDLSLLGQDVDSDDGPASLAYSVVNQPKTGTSSVTGPFLEFRPSGEYDDLAEGKVRIAEIGIRATDRHGEHSPTKTVKVSVTGAADQPNNAPAYVALSPATVSENAAPGTVVGRLFSYDIDGDAVDFALVDDADMKFSINEGRIIVSGEINYEASSVETIRVEGKDPFGGKVVEDIDILIIDRFEATEGRDVIAGGKTSEIFYGLGGNDVVRGRGGNDLIDGGGGNDKLFGEGGRDAILGGKGADKLDGGSGDDALVGQGGRDRLLGGNGADKMVGGGGKDTLDGGRGSDYLLGNKGADVLIGGTGSDNFVYRKIEDSNDKRMDVIDGFDGAGRSGGDRIDVSFIDADLGKKGNQEFSFGDNQGRGHLWSRDDGQDTIIYGNVDRDRFPEFRIRIQDGNMTSADDYVANDFIL